MKFPTRTLRPIPKEQPRSNVAPSNPVFFDTHTHLNDEQFGADREEILTLCRNRGIARIVEIADAPTEWDPAISLSRNHSNWMRCALGLHPYYSDQWNEDLARTLRQKAACSEVAAIGEIGLDYVKSSIPPAIQQEKLPYMLELARELELPVVLHCRGAYADMLTILKKSYSSPPKKWKYWGVLHCFSGNREEALIAVRLGFALGVDGPITYPKNDLLRQAIAAAGLDHIVLETDSPYLPPQSSRGRRNDPRALPEIAERVAESFGIKVEEAARRTLENGEDLFRLSSSGTPSGSADTT